MQNLEDADVVEETSAPGQHGQDCFFKVVDILKPGRTMETEVEVLGFRSSALSSQAWRDHANDSLNDGLDASASPNQYSVIGRAIISTSSSKHWEATIELMQANTKDRFFNMQIFAELLRYIRKICIERFIGHLTMVDTGCVSQKWYYDFFGLAGFSRCRCRSLASSALQFYTWNCLILGKSLSQDLLSVYERTGTWLAGSRCTKTLLDCVAPGKAAGVERRYFHDLRAEPENENCSRVAELDSKLTTRNQILSKRTWRGSMNSLAAPRKVLKPKTKTEVPAKQWSGKDEVVKSVGSSAYRVMKKRKRSRKAKKEGLCRTRRAQDRRARRL